MTAGITKKSGWAFVVWVGTVVLLSSPIFGSVPSTAAVVWLDDFNDGNYDGWTVNGLNFATTPATPADGAFSAVDNTLRATGEGNVWNYADHPSSIAYGT